MDDTKVSVRAYVLLLPFAGMQGHANPMLQLGRRLAYHGLSPTLVVSRLPLRAPHHHSHLWVTSFPYGRHLGRIRRRRDRLVPGHRGVRAPDGGSGVGDTGTACRRRSARGAARPRAGVRVAPALGAPRGGGRRRRRDRVHDAAVRRRPHLRRGVGGEGGPTVDGRERAPRDDRRGAGT
jgi:hypothetical protein